MYDDIGKANSEAAQISDDGSTVYLSKNGTSTSEMKVGWNAPPHFYQTGRMIVIYVGSNTKITQIAEKVSGRQFAGQ